MAFADPGGRPLGFFAGSLGEDDASLGEPAVTGPGTTVFLLGPAAGVAGAAPGERGLVVFVAGMPDNETGVSEPEESMDLAFVVIDPGGRPLGFFPASGGETPGLPAAPTAECLEPVRLFAGGLDESLPVVGEPAHAAVATPFLDFTFREPGGRPLGFFPGSVDVLPKEAGAAPAPAPPAGAGFAFADPGGRPLGFFTTSSRDAPFGEASPAAFPVGGFVLFAVVLALELTTWLLLWPPVDPAVGGGFS